MDSMPGCTVSCPFFGDPWRVPGPLRGILAAMVGSLGLLLESWGAPGAVLEASWNVLKPSWSHLGDVVGALGPIMGDNWEPKRCKMDVQEAWKQSFWRT